MNTRHRIASIATLLLSMASVASAQGITFYEPGDYSGDLGSPTVVTPDLEVGSNLIIGTAVGTATFGDTDIFTVTLPPGLDISGISITCTNYADFTPQDSSRFGILFAASGNFGGVSFDGDGTFVMPFTLGDPQNIVFRITPALAPGTGIHDTFDFTATIDVFDPEPGTSYCAGDGLLIACPCGNDNDGSMSGCDWQGVSGLAGASLSATGSSDPAANDTFLTATNTPGGMGIFFVGNSQTTGLLSDGLRCVGGPILRLAPAASSGTGTHALTSALQTLDPGAVPGATRYYHYWFRSPGGPCSGGSNTSNAYSISW